MINSIVKEIVINLQILLKSYKRKPKNRPSDIDNLSQVQFPEKFTMYENEAEFLQALNFAFNAEVFCITK